MGLTPLNTRPGRELTQHAVAAEVTAQGVPGSPPKRRRYLLGEAFRLIGHPTPGIDVGWECPST